MSAAVSGVEVFCIIILLILSKWRASPTTENTTQFVFTTNRHGDNFTPVYYGFLNLNTSAIALYCSCLTLILLTWGEAVARLVEALHYKSEGRGFD